MKYEKIQGMMSNCSPEIKIYDVSLEEAFQLAKQIPELNQNSKISDWHLRLKDKSGTILIAFINNIPAGLKVGYNKWNDHRYYSWIGGVLPEYRNKGVARALLYEMERRAVKNGFSVLTMKTYNKFKNMLVFALRNGFVIDKAGYEIKSGKVAIHLTKEIH